MHLIISYIIKETWYHLILVQVLCEAGTKTELNMHGFYLGKCLCKRNGKGIKNWTILQTVVEVWFQVKERSLGQHVVDSHAVLESSSKAVGDTEPKLDDNRVLCLPVILVCLLQCPLTSNCPHTQLLSESSLGTQQSMNFKAEQLRPFVKYSLHVGGLQGMCSCYMPSLVSCL